MDTISGGKPQQPSVDLVDRLRAPCARIKSWNYHYSIEDGITGPFDPLHLEAADAIARLHAANRKLHRRCQRAEGKLQRAQTWIDMRAEKEDRRTPYVRREMEHFYLRHILSELARPCPPSGDGE